MGDEIFPPAYIVYLPPLPCRPYLAVTLTANGAITAAPFDTADEAATFNKLMAKTEISRQADLN
ncbi:hypothetical protein [Mesorhizobium ciceri]|uniref:hypothetical protein n=1 Tax=Mesorhizobium TaxID=68287 RepID=UPI0012DF116C|nr:hypothetical protein [Mesorhizobium ciceri]